MRAEPGGSRWIFEINSFQSSVDCGNDDKIVA